MTGRPTLIDFVQIITLIINTTSTTLRLQSQPTEDQLLLLRTFKNGEGKLFLEAYTEPFEV